jgi:hypothetical protein
MRQTFGVRFAADPISDAYWQLDYVWSLCVVDGIMKGNRKT